ncbi:HAMP domain-containing protein [candidate division KSB1 bacterium]|nr:HAMP domain-containing protein [candidate division KSB1 bacterium]
MKWTIGKKMGLSFSSIILMMIILASVSIFLSQFVLETSNYVLEEQYPSVKALDEMTKILYEKRLTYLRYFMTRDKNHLNALAEIQGRYDKNLLSYLTLPLTEEEWALINKFSPLIKQYFTALDEATRYLETHPRDFSTASSRLVAADVLLDKEIIPIISQLEKDKQTVADEMVRQLKMSLNTSTTITIAVSIFAIVIATILSIVLGRNLSRPIIQLTRAADAISLGDLSKSVSVKTRDEISDLAEAIERMRTSLQKAMERLRKRK